MALLNIWQSHKGFVLFIYDNRYIVWVKLGQLLTLFPRSVYRNLLKCRTVLNLFDARWDALYVKNGISFIVSIDRNNSIKHNHDVKIIDHIEMYSGCGLTHSE